MKKLLLALVVVIALPIAAHANGVIDWTGHGSDVLPCADGGHWVLAPAFGIDSAVLTVNGVSYTMQQNGNGSWAADSTGAIDSNVDAFVTYTGAGDHRDHLQLSHCTSGESPSPTESPSPSETESPSPSETESPSPSSSPSKSHTYPPSPTHTRQGPGPRPTQASPTAFTGLESNGYLALGAAVLLAIVGTTALLRGRSKNRG